MGNGKREKVVYKVIHLLVPYKKYIIVMSLLMILITIGNIFTPILQQRIIDNGLMANNITLLLALVSVAVTIIILTNLVSLLQAFLRIDLNARFLKDKQIEILNHALKLRMDYIKNNGIFQIIKDAEYSLNNISQITGNEMSDTLVQMFKFFGVLIGLSIINWKLTLFLLLMVPIRIFITGKISKYVEKYQMDTLLSQKAIHRWEDDIYHSSAEIKLWNLYKMKSNEYRDSLENRNKAVKKMGFFSILNTLCGESVQTIFFNVLYILGGILIWKGSLSIGGILAFITYANYLMEPIGFVSNLKITLSEIGPSIEMYDQFLELEEEETNEEANQKLKCNMNSDISFKFENLEFRFNNRLILKSLNLNLNTGDKIAIVGENGSGKTTLINMLLRFYEIQEGSLKLNDQLISDYELCSYRSLFSVIMQAPYLFNGTIKDNLTLFGTNELSQELLDSELLDFVNKLPDGLNTNIGNNASQISGGEKQKIALIRALANDSKVLILDEPTTAYDKNSIEIFNDLLVRCNKKIVIIITHQPELLSLANKVVEIKKGEAIVYNNSQEYLLTTTLSGGEINGCNI